VFAAGYRSEADSMVVSGVGSLSTDMESSGFFSDIGRGSNAAVARWLNFRCTTQNCCGKINGTGTFLEFDPFCYKSRRRVSVGNSIYWFYFSEPS
jgi:hypothetical protein